MLFHTFNSCLLRHRLQRLLADSPTSSAPGLAAVQQLLLLHELEPLADLADSLSRPRSTIWWRCGWSISMRRVRPIAARAQHQRQSGAVGVFQVHQLLSGDGGIGFEPLRVRLSSARSSTSFCRWGFRSTRSKRSATSWTSISEAERPVQNLLDYALYIMFFPAPRGGADRAAARIPAAARGPSVGPGRGCIWVSQIFLIGLFKKAVIADQLAPIVDPVFANPAHFESSSVWLAVSATPCRSIAISPDTPTWRSGLAHTFGFKLPINFRMPYLAGDITEFWRPLAHHPVDLAARLPVHSAGRQSPRPAAPPIAT